MHLTFIEGFRLKKVVSVLILSDLFLFFGLGLFSPLFGIFILENIEGSSLRVVGMATASFWLARIISVIPISWVFDRVKGVRDEFTAVVIGTSGLALLPLAYIFVSLPWHIFAIEATKGFLYALSMPAWRILFTQYVDKRKVGLSWSLDDFAIGFSTATSAFVGALIVDRFGFTPLFFIMSGIGLVSAFFLSRLYYQEKMITTPQKIFRYIRNIWDND